MCGVGRQGRVDREWKMFSGNEIGKKRIQNKSMKWKQHENAVLKKPCVTCDVITTTPTNDKISRQYESSSTSSIRGSKITNKTKQLTAFSNRFHDLHFHMNHRPISMKSPNTASLYASIQGTTLWAIGIFGTVANGAVFFTVILSKRLKKPLHMLIGTLAATDLFISMVYIPIYTYYMLQADDVASTFCTVSRIMFLEIASVTLTIKTLIALYFYVLARFRERAKEIFSIRNTTFFIITAWFANCCVLFAPEIIGLEIVDFFPNDYLCPTYNAPERLPTSIFTREVIHWICPLVTLFIYVVQLLVIMLCFANVHSAIHRAKDYWMKENADDTSTRVHYSKAEKTMWIIFITFCVCWLPMNVVNIIDISHTILPKWVYNLTMSLLLMKSAINPCIYIYGVRAIRFELKVVCICKCRSNNVKLDNVITGSDDSYLYVDSVTENSFKSKTNSVHVI